MIRIRVLLVCIGAITTFAISAKDVNGNALGRRPVRLKLTGIAALPSNRFALLQVEEQGKAPVLVTLREGAASYDFQLLAIDIGKKEVVVQSSGELLRLWFDEKNSAAPAYGCDPEHAPIPLMPDPLAGEI